MSMTLEDAIAVLEESKRQNEIMKDNPTTFWASYQMADGIKNTKRRIDALDAALSALRPVSGDQANRETGHIVVAPIVQGRAKLFDGSITRPDVQFRGHVHHVCLDRMRNAPEHILRHGLGSLPYAEMAAVEAALCRLLEL